MSAKPTHELALSGVEVELGGRVVLGPVDLAIASGEYVLVVGSSGSGKTTLLRAIAGLVRPRSGRIALGGAVANEGKRMLLRPEERGIGFLFQGGGLWPHLSAARTIEFVLRARKVPKPDRRRRIDELLELVDLPGFHDRLPGTLSGGEAQRLALARALAVEPRILLLDEPLGPVDAELRSTLIARLAELHRRAAPTILHVTHDPGEVTRLATRIVRLERGAIQVAERRDAKELRA